MIKSGGTLTTKAANSVRWTGTTATVPEWLAAAFVSYERIYERQVWVATLVDKISASHARLPLKTYERNADGRPVSEGPYAALMAKPCPTMSNFELWRWTTATLNIHGAAFWVKRRDNGGTGRPTAVFPWHPSRVECVEQVPNSDVVRFYLLDAMGHRVREIDRRDFVHFRMFNPRSMVLGLSPLEPLRAALANEEGALRANSAMWQNGARPSVWLEHPKHLGNGTTERLAAAWNDTHGGVDNWSKAAVLEEGMTARVLPIRYDELQYIEARKLNRDEVCSRFDVPPPVVHILERATYSNITEQMRSMYRDSMGWRINHIEDTLDAELRDGSFGVGEPDFDATEYGEFLMDEVLRGAFETRQEALQKADHMTLAEKRRIENLPYVPGTDRIYVNSASLPIDENGELGPAPTAPVALSDADVRALMGRLGRLRSVDDIDVLKLTKGLPNAAALALTEAVLAAPSDDLDDLRDHVSHTLTEGVDA